MLNADMLVDDSLIALSTIKSKIIDWMTVFTTFVEESKVIVTHWHNS